MSRHPLLKLNYAMGMFMVAENANDRICFGLLPLARRPR